MIDQDPQDHAVPEQESGSDRPSWTWREGLLFLSVVPVCLIAAILISRLIVSVFPGAPTKAVQAMLLQSVAYAFLFAALWLIIRSRDGAPFWTSLGWKVPWPGAGSTIAQGPLLALGIAVTGVILRAPQIDSPIEELLQDRESVLLVGLFAVTLGPLVEEIVFRGFVLPLLVEGIGAPAAVLSSSFVFAALHGPQYAWSWQHLLLLTCASAAFCIVRLRTGSTAASTLVHAAYNLTFFAGFVFYRKDLHL